MLLGDTATSLLFLPGHGMPHGVSVPQRSPDVRTTMVIREHDCWKVERSIAGSTGSASPPWRTSATTLITGISLWPEQRLAHSTRDEALRALKAKLLDLSA